MIVRVSVVLNRTVVDSVYRTGCRNVSNNSELTQQDGRGKKTANLV